MLDKVLVLTPVGDFRGGAERSVLPSIESFVEMGKQVTLLTSNSGDFTDKLEEMGIRVIITGFSESHIKIGRRNFFNALLNILAINIRVFKLIKKERLNLIYCNDALTLEWCILSLIFSFSKCQVLLHERLVGVGFVHRLNIYLLKKKLTIIFTSKFMEEEIKKKLLGGANVCSYTLANPIHLEEGEEGGKGDIREELEIARNKKIIFYLGRIARWKNIRNIIEAISLIDKEKRPHFVIVGKANGEEEESYKSELNELIDKKNVPDFVHFIGFKNKPLRFAKIADIVLLISTNEPFGRVVAEAQGVGTPVIVSNKGGPLEFMDERLGEAVNECDICEIRDAIIRMLEKKYGDKVRSEVAEGVRDKFSVKRYKVCYKKIIQSVYDLNS